MKTPQINIISITSSGTKHRIDVYTVDKNINCPIYTEYSKKEQYWRLLGNIHSGQMSNILKNGISSPEYRNLVCEFTPFMISYWSAMLSDKDGPNTYSAHRTRMLDV